MPYIQHQFGFVSLPRGYQFTVRAERQIKGSWYSEARCQKSVARWGPLHFVICPKVYRLTGRAASRVTRSHATLPLSFPPTGAPIRAPRVSSLQRAFALASLVDSDAQLPQLRLGRLDLAHELFVRLGDVVEGQDAPAQPGQEVRAEGDEGPEGQDRDDLGLDGGGEGDQAEVEGEVDLDGRDDRVRHLGRSVPGGEKERGRNLRSSRGARWRRSAGRASLCLLVRVVCGLLWCGI